ncbi:MAG: FAD-binding oxidoreductase, partial [Myxococcales bacterium]|nr:FAD-binding oxidoreductase [Myxococcales bacterium]
MTTYATEPLAPRETRISKPKSRPAEIETTLDTRFSLPDRRTPSDLQELVALVQEAIDTKRELRVVGAARGLSTATDPVGAITVSTENLSRVYTAAGRDILGLRRVKGVDPKTIARVQAGTPARSVLRTLTSMSPPRTLINHGSGDFQSIMGAISTGTHGTGPFPSLAGLVRAIVVVRVDASGPTPVPRVELVQRSGKAKGDQRPCYANPKGGTWTGAGGIPIHAVYDDDTFFAHIVGLGCLGLVYSVTLDIIDRVPLMEESRIPDRLDRMLARATAEYATPGLRLEMIVDPFPRDTRSGPEPKRWDAIVPLPASRDFTVFRGQYIRRTPSDAAGPRGDLPLSIEIGSKPEAAGLIGDKIGDLIDDPAHCMPKGADSMIQCSSLDSYIDWLPNVLLLNLKYVGTGSEWAVPWPHLQDALWA